jgi:tetratricopeptide (TPR) repeat protein
VKEARKKRHEANEAKHRADMARIERDQVAGAGAALPAVVVAAQSLLQGQAISNPDERLKLERFVVSFLTGGGVPPSASEALQIKEDVAVLVTSDDPKERRALGLIAEREAREGFALLLSEARAAQAASDTELAERFGRIGRLAFFRDVGAGIEAFEAAVRLNPKDVDSHIRLARLLGKVNRTTEARARLENAVALADKPLDKAEARARLAEHLLWNGGVGEAADAAARAITDARVLVEHNPLGREQLALALTFAGRIALKQGDSNAAAAHMRAAIAEARALCAASQSPPSRLRLCEALAHASNAIRRAEGLDAGVQMALEATGIAREVAARPDAPPDAQRDVSLSLIGLGDLAASAGDRATAEACFTEALKIAKARAAADPKDSQAQRDVSLSLIRLGDLAASAGDRATAEARFTEALKIAKGRAAADPKDSEAERDVSVSLGKLGDLAASAGDRAMAEARFTEALKIAKARAAADPQDSQAQADVALSLGRNRGAVRSTRRARRRFEELRRGRAGHGGALCEGLRARDMAQ